MATLAQSQGGHVTRKQLLALGASSDVIKHNRLLPVYTGVYAVGHPPTLPIDRAKGGYS
jgi:hypothetical protein